MSSEQASLRTPTRPTAGAPTARQPAPPAAGQTPEQMIHHEDPDDMAEADAAILEAEEPAAARPATTRTAILVVGMHRSGTSALTRVLNLVGCDGAKTVIEGDRFNERGYWEAADIAALNDDLLELDGSSWNDWSASEQSWRASPARPDLDARADRVLSHHFADQTLFVLKDPRLCRLLPFWQDALERFGADVRVVLPVRHPVEVAASLLKRNGLNPSVAQLTWLRNVLEAEHHSRGLRRAFIQYDDLLQDWRGVLGRVSEELQVEWPALTDESGRDVDEFLSRSLRHHTRTSEDTLQHTSLIKAPVLAEVFSILASGARSAGDLDRLDARRREFDAASILFQQPVTEIEAHGRRLKAMLDGEKAARAALEVQVAERSAEVDRAHAEVRALQRQEEEARDQGLALQLLLSELRSVYRMSVKEAEHLGQLVPDYNKLKRRLRKQTNQVGDLRKRLSRRDQELAAARHSLDTVLRSASWRVTSPYRRIRGWLA